MSDNDPIVHEQVELAVAVRRIKASRNRKIYLACNQRAPIADEPDKYFPVMGYVQVNAPTAVRFLESAYSTFDTRGAQVRIGVSTRCMFVG
jgi:hypothetical protein